MHTKLKGIIFRIEKVVNTIIWAVFPQKKVLVLNVHLKNCVNKINPINLGDDLNLVVAKELSNRTIVNTLYSFISVFKPLNYMCIGSIVDTLTNKQSIIWGSGAMYGDENKIIIKPKKVFAVRGPLTRQYLLGQGISCPEIYGDPAILLPLFYSCKREKKYKMGLIPHYADYNTLIVNNIQKRYGEDVKVINMKKYKKWENIVESICECDFIISSSLHGLIIADAYGVPNLWIKLSDRVKGDDFKFRDYFEGCKKTNIKPIDCRIEDISLEFFKNKLSQYKRPQYNIHGLLNSCPFITEEKKKELLLRIGGDV